MPALSYGWGEKGVEGSPEEKFWMRFDACTRQPRSFKEEVYAAARAIADSTDRPLWLCSSGGVDSEIMCRAFHEQGIPFSVLTLRHTGGTNKYDIRYAAKWCEERGIRQVIKDIDMDHMLTSGMDRFIKDGYISGKPYHYMKILMLETIEAMGGFGVVGSGEQRHLLDPKIEQPTTNDVHLDLGIGYVASVEWCRRNNLKHEPFFLHHTPELNLSYLQVPIVQHLLANPLPLRNVYNQYYIKKFVYHTIWLDLEPRIKFTGFERVRPLAIASVNHLKSVFGTKIQSAVIPIPALLEQLWPHGPVPAAAPERAGMSS